MEDKIITIRSIVYEALDFVSEPKKDEQVDRCIQKIKQKLAHLRRVMYQELQMKTLLQTYENIPGSETMSIQKPLSTDEILDIVYNELDHALEGLDHDKKNLTDMSRRE